MCYQFHQTGLLQPIPNQINQANQEVEAAAIPAKRGFVGQRKVPFLEKRNVIGVEASGEMARIARRRCPGLRGIGATLRSLPFGTGSIDVIVSAYAWHHLSPEDRLDSIGEMRRVLRDRGQVIVADIMFRDARSEHSMREQLEKAGERAKLALLDEESEEYPLLSELRVEFGRFGFVFSGKQRTELVWLFRAKLP